MARLAYARADPADADAFNANAIRGTDATQFRPWQTGALSLEGGQPLQAGGWGEGVASGAQGDAGGWPLLRNPPSSATGSTSAADRRHVLAALSRALRMQHR